MDIINWKELLNPYERAVRELELKFRAIASGYREMSEYSPIEMVYGRVKDRASIISKASKKNIPLDRIEEEIDDLAGLRIIVRFVEDIIKVRDIIRSRSFDMTVMKEKDYITNIKPSGYRSYHIIVKYPVYGFCGFKEIMAEIQIRTMAMNFWASSEHSLRYKYSGNIPPAIKQRLISCAEAAFNLDKEMETIRAELVEAQRVMARKNNLVQDILENFKKLHQAENMDSLDDLNKEFFDVYEDGNLEDLSAFNKSLIVLLELFDTDKKEL